VSDSRRRTARRARTGAPPKVVPGPRVAPARVRPERRFESVDDTRLVGHDAPAAVAVPARSGRFPVLREDDRTVVDDGVLGVVVVVAGVLATDEAHLDAGRDEAVEEVGLRCVRPDRVALQ